MSQELRSLFWTGSSLRVLDQLRLPFSIEYIECASYRDVHDVIRNMNTRGAPAIGVAAAYGMALAAREAERSQNPRQFMLEAAATLKSARPTAVNLGWSVDRASAIAERTADRGPAVVSVELLKNADELAADDEQHNLSISRFGAELFDNGDAILTICNTGALATYRYGTAFGAINEAFRQGKRIEVYALETRPYLQGARLTALELVHAGIPFRLITDGMAGICMARRMVNKVIVGADRIAANGDFANKIGTYQLAVLAQYHHLPFYAAAPLSSFDLHIESGQQIPVEERDEEEVLSMAGHRIAAEGAHAFNPSFDVTPHELVSGIVTELGVFRPPFGHWERP
jgi:methylthioribose-1-phosphate isomerase